MDQVKNPVGKSRKTKFFLKKFCVVFQNDGFGCEARGTALPNWHFEEMKQSKEQINLLNFS